VRDQRGRGKGKGACSSSLNKGGRKIPADEKVPRKGRKRGIISALGFHVKGIGSPYSEDDWRFKEVKKPSKDDRGGGPAGKIKTKYNLRSAPEKTEEIHQKVLRETGRGRAFSRTIAVGGTEELKEELVVHGEKQAAFRDRTNKLKDHGGGGSSENGRGRTAEN